MNTLVKEIKADNKEFLLILIHLGLGVAIFIAPFLSTVLSVGIGGFAIFQIVKNSDAKNQVLLYSAYITGAEVLFRMSKGLLLYEFCKYLVVIFFLIGIINKQIARSSTIYLLYLVLLIPGIFVTMMDINTDIIIRKAIAFNLAGPVCLGLAALYCYNRKIDYAFFNKLMLYLLLPIISITVYLFLYTPDLQDVITNTESNAYTSGGYGPNQVSTVLGLGMFICAIRFFLFSPSLFWKLANATLFIIISFRGLLTFSRGGFLTALIMIAVFTFFLFLYSTARMRSNVLVIGFFGLIAITGVWTYTVSVSGGLIENRYTGKNTLGQEEEDFSSGRFDILETELAAFYQNPFTGIGVGNNKYFRFDTTGIESASHNEVTRILSEHGIAGVFALLIIFFTPILRFLSFHRNVFVFSFFLFWFLTINHSAMRIAAPAFVYGLTLLTITSEKTVIHRK
ncbi:O-antigen ligase family protein [Ascidiimonas sp. W6]|uniref:O-antigen ligase family protein n=1 Tax=Ascidiimonas meishanensis TaxID=3128903 RepID=UPI0030EC6651